MTDEAALLAAIRANPREDTPRLMYADFLEERGRPEDLAHADAVRRGCAKPKRFTFGPGLPATVSYTPTRRDLPAIVGVTLACGVPGVKWTTCRGFVEGVNCAWGVWAACGDGWLEEHPLTAVALAGRPALPPAALTGDYDAYVAGRLVVLPPLRAGKLLHDDRLAEILSARWPRIEPAGWDWPGRHPEPDEPATGDPPFREAYGPWAASRSARRGR